MSPSATLTRTLALAALLAVVNGARRGAAVGATGNARLAANQPAAALSAPASGAQLFQSPAALAAAAAAALPGLAVQASPLQSAGAPVVGPGAPSALAASAPANLLLGVSGRLDTSELLKQQLSQGANLQQQQQQQQHASGSLNMEQGKCDQARHNDLL